MSSRLFLQERREYILSILDETGRVAVIDLSEKLGLSAATIRSDLDALANQGLLTRTHGGAISVNHVESELSFQVRTRLSETQKQRIGTAAAGMVQDGEAIALDASTTALALAKQLKTRRELTVITNGLFIALELLDAAGITTLMPGGFLRRDSVSLVGSEGHDFINRYNFQKGFFGAKGLTLEEGLTDVDSDEVTIKCSLVRLAKQVIAIVDSSKWGRVSFASFASLDQIDCIITDEGAPLEMVQALQARGIEVIIT
jgi:DeoR/GlpR family transcriptional regulator of sugar metabolism